MDLPIIQRRDYGDYGGYDQSNDQQSKTTTDLNETSSENRKYVVIHISIIFSVLTFIAIIGFLLYLYRRKLQRLNSLNLNRVVNITHIKNTDNGINNLLDYYSNDYNNSNKSSADSAYPSDIKMHPRLEPLEPVHENESESESRPSGSPTSSISNGNRNYFIYAKSSRIRSDLSTSVSRNNSELKRSDNNIINNNANKLILDNNSKSNGSIKLNNNNKRPRLNINQISPPVTSLSSPSDSIYNKEIADSLSRTATRVIPPIPTFPSNKYVQPKEILRGPGMLENYLVRQDSDATITINTVFNDNPIMDVTKENDLNNKIIFNKTTEEMVLDMMPYDNGSNFNNSYLRLSREVNIFDKSSHAVE